MRLHLLEPGAAGEGLGDDEPSVGDFQRQRWQPTRSRAAYHLGPFHRIANRVVAWTFEQPAIGVPVDHVAAGMRAYRPCSDGFLLVVRRAAACMIWPGNSRIARRWAHARPSAPDDCRTDRAIRSLSPIVRQHPSRPWIAIVGFLLAVYAELDHGCSSLLNVGT